MRRAKLAFFFVCRAIGLFRLARWVTRRRLKILCYHGFAFEDEAAFRPKLFLSPARFEERLETIRRSALRVLPLDEAIRGLYSGSLPEHSLVITADDGFHSFRALAVPRLERLGYPATIFVTSYYVQHPNPVFRLAVQYMFWKTPNRELVLRGVPWSADRVVDLGDAAAAEKAMWECIEHGELRATEAERCAMCEVLGGLLGTPYREMVASRKFHLMAPEELRRLAAARVSVGLHTHRHRFPDDDREKAEREIADNRSMLSGWLGHEIRHFAYPSGLWDRRQWAWLDALGVESSSTCDPGLNSSQTPRHALLRFLDGENIHPLEFEAALTGFSDLLRSRGRDREVTTGTGSPQSPRRGASS